MPKEFINLHCHTTFSFRDAYGQPSQHAARAASVGASALAITDHGSISGWVRHMKACRKEGIKPLYGCEFYMVDNLKGDAEVRKHRDHLTVIARNQQGLRNIMALLSIAWENFYYKPILDYRTLSKYGEGLLVLSGCMYGKYAQRVWKDGNEDAAANLAKSFRSRFGDGFFLEVQSFNIPECKLAATAAVNHAEELGIPVVLTNDAHYPGPEDAAGRNLLLRVTPGWTPDTKESPLWQYNRKEAFASMRSSWPKAPKELLTQLLDNSRVAADLCEDMDLPRPERLKYISVDFDNTHDDFVASVKRGWKTRGLSTLTGDNRKVYKARLNREMGLIREKGFEDYLMTVADIITWAKSVNIVVGPARGSSAGSLVCWLLGITEIDPVRWGLLFERFIDINRMDPPDIDTDFEDARRSEVHDYVRDKYGADHFAQMCTFAQYKPKGALSDVAKAFGIPREPVETLKGFIIERSSADARASNCLEDTIEAFPAAQEVIAAFPDLRQATLLEGQYRQTGRHACGVIISQEPLREHMALIRGDDGTQMTCYEGFDAADLGALKLDILSLRSLSIISEILKVIGKDIAWLYSLPFDDEETYKGFQRGDLTGVFQFTGQSTESVCKQMPPKDFMELADINALSRPGPLHSGSTTIYIAARNGQSEVKKYHPSYDKATESTHGVIVYQEQIMVVGIEMAGLSWEEVSALRKIISKKLGVEGFNKYKKAFVDGALRTNGVPAEISEEIWANICTHGSWSFNKSHAVAYALISYLMMYLKVHYRTVFNWANLVTLTDKKKAVYVLRDLVNKEGVVLPVTLNGSGFTWTIDGEGLRPGLLEIAGIGKVTSEELIANQPYKDLADLRARTNNRKVHAGIIRALTEHGLLTRDGEIGEGDDDVWGLRKLKEAIDDLPVTHRIAELGWGKEQFCIVAGKIIEKNVRDIFEIAYSKRGEILDPDKVHRPDLPSYINITLEDDTDSIYATFDRFIYPRIREIIVNTANEPDDIFLIKGTKTEHFRKVYAKTVVNVSLQAREEKALRDEERAAAKPRKGVKK
jgi:DNA polymerase-3 subunit alpha